MTTKHAVIRADASPAMGAGHAMRCLALAEAMRGEGWTIDFAGIENTLKTVPEIVRGGQFVPLSQWDDPAELMAVRSDGCDLLVVDHYGLDARYEAACRPWAKRIFVIDDLADRHHDCDVLLDQTLDRTFEDYAEFVPATCRVLLGAGYTLLRSSFAVTREGGIDRGDVARRLFVSVGATDAGAMLSPIMEALSGFPIDLNIAVNSSAAHLTEIKRVAGETKSRLFVDAKNIAELMAEADLAVLTASSTSREAACLGTPMILIVTADNQREVAASMARRGIARVANGLEELTTIVDRLIGNSSERRQFGRAAAQTCDGRGAQRIVMALCPEKAADSHPVRLRRVSHDDADLLLEWQMDPETRRFSRNPEIPDRVSHLAWFDRKLAELTCLMDIVLYGNEPAGVLRLDRKAGEPSMFEVSIFTAPAMHRRGIGAAALRLARRLVPDADLLANILPGNVASMKLFENAGFRSIGNGWFSQAPSTPVVSN